MIEHDEQPVRIGVSSGNPGISPSWQPGGQLDARPVAVNHIGLLKQGELLVGAGPLLAPAVLVIDQIGERHMMAAGGEKQIAGPERVPHRQRQRNVPEAVGGILDLSDLVIVSGESISMVSEALSSGKPTIVFSPDGRYQLKPRDKYEEFVLKLHDQGYVMVSSIDGIKAKIAQLLNRKIMLQSLDDQAIIQKGLEAIVS